jgi:AmiR/NasT family two-component response regulator
MTTQGADTMRGARRAAQGSPAGGPAPIQSRPPRWRLVVIDDHVASRALVRAAVARAGGAVVAEAETAAAGIDLVAQERPDAAVIAVGLPDGDGIDAAAEIDRRSPCPVVVLTSHADQGVIERARRAGAMAYLVKPLRAEELAPAVELAIARFTELARAGREAAALRQALEDRKTIERAKGLLMDRLGLTEAVAFRLLQKSAMDRRTPIVALAERVLAGETLPPTSERR